MSKTRIATYAIGMVLTIGALFLGLLGTVTLTPFASLAPFSAPAYLVPLISFGGGALLAVGFLPGWGEAPSARQLIGAAVLILGILGFGFLMILAATAPVEPMNPARAGIVFLCGTLALLAALAAFEALGSGRPIEFETSWGGVGGGMGGWRLSTTAALAALAVIFASATVTIGALDGTGDGNSNGADTNEAEANDAASETESTANNAATDATGEAEANGAANVAANMSNIAGGP